MLETEDSASCRAEVTKYALSVVGLPGLAGVAGGVLLVEADEQVGQLTTDRLHIQQRGQLGEIDQPVGIPAGPVVIGAIHDPEDTMMGLGCLMEEAACLVESVCHGVSTARRTQREPTWIPDPPIRSSPDVNDACISWHDSVPSTSQTDQHAVGQWRHRLYALVRFTPHQRRALAMHVTVPGPTALLVAALPWPCPTRQGSRSDRAAFAQEVECAPELVAGVRGVTPERYPGTMAAPVLMAAAYGLSPVMALLGYSTLTAQTRGRRRAEAAQCQDLARASSAAPVAAASPRNPLASNARSSSTSMPGRSRCSSRRATLASSQSAADPSAAPSSPRVPVSARVLGAAQVPGKAHLVADLAQPPAVPLSAGGFSELRPSRAGVRVPPERTPGVCGQASGPATTSN